LLPSLGFGAILLLPTFVGIAPSTAPLIRCGDEALPRSTQRSLCRELFAKSPWIQALNDESGNLLAGIRTDKEQK
jgi:hypothetical protein